MKTNFQTLKGGMGQYKKIEKTELTLKSKITGGLTALSLVVLIYLLIPY